MATTLTDPENRNRSAEEVAELAIAALDEIRSRTHRLAVVGQVRYEPQDPPQTVVLGPFSSRGIIDAPEKFRATVSGGTAARDAGQGLAWDSKTGRGRGRFMLAPAFLRPRDAWDFFRVGREDAADITAVVAGWAPPEIGPVCTCGLVGEIACHVCGASYERHCFRHESGADTHRCRRAA
ncbi:hypothetical protein [Streptomyces demainii]|uniref:C2H2-type domain-containing protein n=1 Tax=Streptomyces demainii TaxID=588122 RepID=A0ABT9KT47_9ACTN|nr:hypothetical protein [Streptomyces demainii]MDP9611575.1 hypothetical protein [Streptomyces demainii]